jgi:glycosyltransferase involved in cell wall biosynthesis
VADSIDGSSTPFVSLVIASRTGSEPLLACIESFARFEDESFEVIVAECAEPTTPATIRAHFPSVRVLHFAESRTIPDLRAAGLLAARGAIVAVTSDRCRAEDGWLRAVQSSHERPVGAVGGAIENAVTNRILDWAVFFCEYGRYMPPLSSEATSDLPGHNVAYTRTALDAIRDLFSPACWDPLWHKRLEERGLTLAREPSMLVSLHKRSSLSAFIAERYDYSRSFAGQRVAGRPWLIRFIRAATTPLLPPILLVRLVRQILPKRRHRRELAFSMPYLALFALVWAAGECVGYVAGPGTNAHHID